VRFDEPKVKVARYLFDRHGGKVVFFGRFVSVLRAYAAFLAGTTRMEYRRFFFFNASGGILWAGFYTFVAYYAGSTLSKLSTPLDIAFVALAVGFIVTGTILVRRSYARLLVAAEAAYPDPLSAK
jgi:membrane protein DedA with SNARE-associated domain